MPTQAKIDKVSELKEKLEKCSIVVTASYSNIPVNEMTELRRRTREAGVEFLVIKNSLMGLAADAAQVPQLKEIMQGPTAIALGYDEPVDVARTLHDYIRSTRSALVIQGAVMGGGPVLQKPEVERLATLPPKDQLVAQLLGQLQAPIYGLLSVLSGPLRSFGGLLQARIHQLETEGAAATATTIEDEAPVAEAAANTTETDAVAEEPQAAAADEAPAADAAADTTETDAVAEEPQAAVADEAPVAEAAADTTETDAIAEEPQAADANEAPAAEAAADTAEADAVAEEPQAAAADEAPVAEAAADTTETDAVAEEPQAAAEADAGSDEAETTDSEDSGPKDAG